jgi:hypothetical protein
VRRSDTTSGYIGKLTEFEQIKLKHELWKKAFPLAGFAPPLSAPTDDDKRLAQKFCPELHVKKELFIKERKALRDSFEHVNYSEFALKLLKILSFLYSDPLGNFSLKMAAKQLMVRNKLAESLFLLRVGRFPEEYIDGAAFYLLFCSLKEELENYKYIRGLFEKGEEKARAYNLEIYESMAKKYTNLDDVRPLVSTLFEEQVSDDKPTCVIKYRVMRSLNNPNLCCIQYFSYWPIQIRPPHVFDYEPIYVFVNEAKEETESTTLEHRSPEEPLLIVFNANPGSLTKKLGPLTHGKRPGHVIRTFINWNSTALRTSIHPSQFNSMADYMTRAYGADYLYEEINNTEDSHIDQLFQFNGMHCDRPQFIVSESYHAYNTPNQGGSNLEKVGSELLQPLKTQDLLHIEWDIRNPFQAPFLYPLIGKDPRLHLPFDLNSLCNSETVRTTFVEEVNYSVEQLSQTVPYQAEINECRCELLTKIAHVLKSAN